MNGKLIVNASQIVTNRGRAFAKGPSMADVTVIENGCIVVEDDRIKAVWTQEQCRDRLRDMSGYEVVNAAGKCVLPGFVDSHTHFIFGGYRPAEFIRRLKGETYLGILREGGGIRSTVRATRSASNEELFTRGKKRLDSMLLQGVTTVEGKSGYGLDLETELTMLNVMNALNCSHPVDIVTTYLGAHAVPEEQKSAGAYVDYIIGTVLPGVREAGLAEFCDVFCEDGVFSLSQSKKLLRAAKKMGFKLKIHADEMVPLGATELAVKLGATSADHLLAASEEGIEALARGGTVATLLPCTAFCLKKPYAKARRMIDGGCAVALASDFNPGSCFTDSIPLLLALAVIHMDMSVEEAITAITLNGAAALGRADQIGTIEPGKKADLVFLKYPDYRFLVYHTGMNIVENVMKSGEFVHATRNVRISGDLCPTRHISGKSGEA